MHPSLLAPAPRRRETEQVPPCTFFAVSPHPARVPCCLFGCDSARATDSRRHTNPDYLYTQHSVKVAAVFTMVAFAAVLGLAIHAVANIRHKVLQDTESDSVTRALAKV